MAERGSSAAVHGAGAPQEGEEGRMDTALCWVHWREEDRDDSPPLSRGGCLMVV